MKHENQEYYIRQIKDYLTATPPCRGQLPLASLKTFGCQMNDRESEMLAGILIAAGFSLTENEEEADLVVYNTCSIRDNVNRRIFGRLGHLGYLKTKNPQMKIALCGCMMQEMTVVEKLTRDYGFVDLIFGTHNVQYFAEYLAAMYVERERVIEVWEHETDAAELKKLPNKRKYAFKSGVIIMHGCDNYCAYCIVPYVRGRERSRSADAILEEIRGLVADGVKEVMLLGQNVNSYGLTGSVNTLESCLIPSSEVKACDLCEGVVAHGQMNFATLLKQIEGIEGLERIRFMTSHPKDLTDELIRTIGESKKICHHLHLPLQSGSTKLLKAMNRHYSKEEYLELVRKLRASLPEIAITTDIIVGFPGETDADFADTLDVVEKVGFDNAFTFLFSKRTGTKAATMDNQVSGEVVKERFLRLVEAVRETAKERLLTRVGQSLQVLVEGVNSQEEGLLDGRLSCNVLVHFAGERDLIGEIVVVRLVEACGFYYLGEMVD
ncbi:MAG: MiaB/RimO family radical SAM methylthiotransferase [Lachnospiraceae bacterium]|jgi:tRNA-2-methylthio-N6-dimethylallyladenosine synthase|nr:MiaB/RimO family radical SAM methylthiotransferase [Lachnospiraceae bacterium]